MTRKEVYKLIDGERAYQDTDPHSAGHDDPMRSVADWVIFIEAQLTAAKEQVYYLQPWRACENIRKIAALAVACMEHNETPPRQ